MKYTSCVVETQVLCAFVLLLAAKAKKGSVS